MIVPTVTLYKDGKHVIVNQSDAAEWNAKGWKAKADDQSKAKADDKKA
jgi:hypothetical protein